MLLQTYLQKLRTEEWTNRQTEKNQCSDRSFGCLMMILHLKLNQVITLGSAWCWKSDLLMILHDRSHLKIWSLYYIFCTFCDTSCLSWESHGCAWQDHGGTMFLRLGVSGRQAKDVHCGNWPSWYCFALVLRAIWWISVPPTCMSTPCSSWGLSCPCLSLAVVNLHPYSPDEHPTSKSVLGKSIFKKKSSYAFHQMLWDDHFPTKRGMWWRKKDESGFTYSTNDRPWRIPFLIPSPHPNSFHSNLLRMRLIAYTDYNAIMRTPILRTPIGDHFVRRRGMGVRGTRAERGTPPTGVQLTIS